MIVHFRLFEACRRLITSRVAVRKKIVWIFKRRIFFVSAATALRSVQALHKTEASAEVFAMLGSGRLSGYFA
jgi:hypothetical protein